MLSEAFFGCQRHKNMVNYTIFTRGQYQKIMKNWPKIDQKTANKDLQNASSNFTLFFPTPNPQKRENPSRLKDFRGGSAAGARPRVAKAMLSCHHYTARHRRIKGCRPCRRPRKNGERGNSTINISHMCVCPTKLSFFHLISILLRAAGCCWLAASCCTAAAALTAAADERLRNTSRQ